MLRGDARFHQILPDYKHQYQDKSVRSWGPNNTKSEGYRDNDYTNIFGVPMRAPDFCGSDLIGACYPGQSGQQFGGPSHTKGSWPGLTRQWNKTHHASDPTNTRFATLYDQDIQDMESPSQSVKGPD